MSERRHTEKENCSRSSYTNAVRQENDPSSRSSSFSSSKAGGFVSLWENNLKDFDGKWRGWTEKTPSWEWKRHIFPFDFSGNVLESMTIALWIHRRFVSSFPSLETDTLSQNERESSLASSSSPSSISLSVSKGCSVLVFQFHLVEETGKQMQRIPDTNSWLFVIWFLDLKLLPTQASPVQKTDFWDCVSSRNLYLTRVWWFWVYCSYKWHHVMKLQYNFPFQLSLHKETIYSFLLPSFDEMWRSGVRDVWCTFLERCFSLF